MNRQLDDLLLQRGRLIERIAGQRSALRQDIQPVSAVLERADSVVDKVRAGVGYIRQHPALVSAGVALLLMLRGRKILQLSGRAFSAWQFWRLLQSRLKGLGGRVRS